MKNLTLEQLIDEVGFEFDCANVERGCKVESLIRVRVVGFYIIHVHNNIMYVLQIGFDFHIFYRWTDLEMTC